MELQFYTFIKNSIGIRRRMIDISCPAPGRKNRATQLDPQHHGYFLSPVPRAGYALATLQRPATHSVFTHYKCVVCNLYCVQNSHRQVSIGQNLKRFKHIINHNIYICTT
jgi:hypothetical protein